MAFKLLDSTTIRRILDALHPRFIGRDQDHLITLADESGAIAYEAAQTYVQPLYDFRNDIESTAGAALVGINDAGSFFTGTNVETALQEIGDFKTNHFTFADLGGKPTTIAGYGITDAQAKDATLTALAGQNWAADAIPVGTGADTVTQLALGANTFPAKSSAGSVAAKTITDFGLSLVDDANATAARTTLVMSDGTFASSLTSVANITGTPTVDKFIYTRIGSIVHVAGQVTLTTTAAATTQFRLTIPVASNFSNNEEAVGTVTAGTGTAGFVRADPATDQLFIQFTATVAAAHGVRFVGMYQVI